MVTLGRYPSKRRAFETSAQVRGTSPGWGGRRSIVRRVLRALPVDETVAFFRDLGVRLHEEPDGKLFPDSNRARDVLTALLRELSRCDVTLLADHRVRAIERTVRGFRVETSQGAVDAPRLVLATSLPSNPTGNEIVPLNRGDRKCQSSS